MRRFMWLGAAVVVVVAVWYLAREADATRVRLPDGRDFKLISSIAMFDGSACRMLTFEYISALAPAERERLQHEAGEFLQAVAADSRYNRCKVATVSARLPGEKPDVPMPWERVFTFERNEPGVRWSFRRSLQ
jgi:hypothetical protein